jgi:hypothetical protein
MKAFKAFLVRAPCVGSEEKVWDNLHPLVVEPEVSVFVEGGQAKHSSGMFSMKAFRAFLSPVATCARQRK